MDPQARFGLHRVVSRLRRHLKGDLGQHVIVVVDEIEQITLRRPGHLSQANASGHLERGRYLGMVLFSAQRFRSRVLQTHLVGNSATIVYGRMDMDRLAPPGYQVLTAATKRLATSRRGN
jgi:hypothetical protein